MRKEDREALAARALSYSAAGETEVLVSSLDDALTRFTRESVNQNVAASDALVSVRAIHDGHTGVVRTNRLDDASLRESARRALAIARLTPSDALAGDLPAGGATQTPPGAFDAPTAQAAAADRARICSEIFEAARGDGCWCAGYVSSGRDGITVANTNGVMASFDGTNAAVNVKMNAADSTGFAECYANAIGAIDGGRAGATAARKARDGASPRAVEPGRWTVILEPAAFGEMLAYLTEHFSAQAFEEGSSFCSDGLDRRYFGENVTIRDDYAHPLAPGMPFDFEGQPTQRLTLVERGVVRNIVTDSYYARKLQRPNTGHALPAPNAYGPQAMHVVVDPGTASTDELIAGTERGLLITRFWYIRTVDRKKAIVTGMTRDGTFLIERGRLAGGVRNMRFNQSVIDMLAHCEFSAHQQRTGGYDHSTVVPAAKVDGFTFTSTTEF